MNSESRGPEGLKTFDVYVREERGERVGTAIKRGFSWPGLLFTFMWAFANRLWLLGAVLITSVTFFNILWMGFLEEIPVLGWAFSVISFAIAVFVGYKGNELHGARREAEGFRRETTVQGQNPAEVLDRLGIPKAYAQAYSVGGVVAASIFTALALFSAVVVAALIIAGEWDEAMSTPLPLLCWTGIPALLLWVRSLRGPLSVPKGLAWGFGAYLLAAPLGLFFMLASERGESALEGRAADERTAPLINSVAVLPIVNVSGEPEQEQLADELTEALISEIADMGVGVIPYASVITLKDADNAVQIVRDLGVDAVLEGSVQRMESRIRIVVQLIHLPSQTHLYANSYDRALEDLSRVVQEVATQVSSYGRE